MDTRDPIDKEPDMRQRLLEKWRLLADALAGIDNPHGESLRVLENRIRRLEGEVEDVRDRLLSDTLAPTRSADFPPTG